MKVKEGMYMKKILEAIKNFFSALTKGSERNTGD